MKKAGMALVSVLLAGSLAALTACGENGTDLGKVDGNFTSAATDEQMESALSSIDFEKMFGDVSADDWTYGLQLESVFNAEFSLNSSGISIKYTVDSSTEAKFSLKQDQSQSSLYGFAVAGVGEETAKIKTESSMGGESFSANCEMDANFYIDNSAVYLDTSTSGMEDVLGQADINAKSKIYISDIIGLIMDIIESGEEEEYPGISFMADEDIIENEDSDLSGYLDLIAEMGLKTYLDDSEGLKIKISAGDCVKAEIGADVTWTSCVLDVYFVIDENGAFQQFSIDVDINFKSLYTVSVKGGVKVTPYNGTVTLPAGIADDESYEEIDFTQMPSLPGGMF